ncbi:hypothetical protein [Streptomyces sp. NPDC047706]|uniref:hypothetical protein n=1 Tax=Streptomyces sp. NPDC047706 TaxID=3365486 RepID=UPI00371AD831
MSQDPHTPNSTPGTGLSARLTASDPVVGVSGRSSAPEAPQAGAEGFDLRDRLTALRARWQAAGPPPGVSRWWDIRLAELDTALDGTPAPAAPAGYCPHCGRGDCAPTPEAYEQQRQRADQAEAALAELRVELDRARRVALSVLDCDPNACRHQATIERVRRLATAARDATAAGRNDWQIGQHNCAVAVLAALDGKPAPAHDAGPTVRDCADADRAWPLQKHGE